MSNFFESLQKKSISNQENVKHFLRDGLQTKITPQIKKIADGLKRDGFEDSINSIIDYTKSIPLNEINKYEVFRKRTADQIINDRYHTGCTDIALVFIVLARALGIPSKYIETIQASFLEKKYEEISNYKKHIYVSILKDENNKKEWIMVDPTRRKIGVNLGEDGMIIVNEGLDSWDVGAKDLNSTNKKFIDFRNSKF